MAKLLRLSGTAVAAVIGVHVLDWLLTPVLPLLVSLLAMAFIAYLVWG